MSQALQEKKFIASGPAYLLITCQGDSGIHIMDEIQTIPGVKGVEATIGPYDLVAKLESRSIGSLRDTISKIRKIPEIRATTTVVCE